MYTAITSSIFSPVKLSSTKPYVSFLFSAGCFFTLQKTLFNISKAFSPLILIMPIPPSPMAVATAAMVSSYINISFKTIIARRN